MQASTNCSNTGETIYYRCKFLPKTQAKNCKRLKVFKPANDLEFIVSVTIGEHNHSAATQSKIQLQKPEFRKYVYDLKYKDRMKPRAIKEHLKRNRPNDPSPNIRKIRYMLKSLEKENIPSTFSFGELIEWLKTKTSVPDSIDEAFVVNWTYEKRDDSFAFVVSTRRLLINAVGQPNLSADGTYKVLWQSCPVIVVGIVDRQKHLHVTAIVVTSNERKSEYQFVFETIRMGIERESETMHKPEVIISDHAAAIRNGFFGAFGPSKNVICSVHMFRKLRERSEYSSKENKGKIIEDIRVLHSSPDEKSFDHATLLFLDKWQKSDEDFCNYFKATWLGETTRNWYRGYSPFVPDHNNAVVGISFYLDRRNGSFLNVNEYCIFSGGN